ncbi:VOC family protein [Parafrankia sp. BMG5.11]|uniref:VOC family protein n=1 Tax=Parafrankia sp. BMG5.11 TaxID=222540 RepID=UPI00103E0720|nr:VOC family protein [Parafrankia sp. BMG5.11]TCJ36995.1 VOC family protein [Parafrankia sp. BMG5.11]
MTEARPTGTNFGMTYGFAKTFVHALEEMGAFYQAVFGLIEAGRHSDIMLGRPIDEIMYQASYPGGPGLTLIKYRDSTGPVVGEAVQGFITDDIERVVERAESAGGTIGEPGIFRVEDYGIRCVFVLDPEGHVNEVIQFDETPS